MIKSTAIAIFAILTTNAAMAAGFDGTWAQNPAHCTAAYPETRVQIAGSDIKFVESSCKLGNATGLRDMPQAKLFDLQCSGEGTTWSERMLVGTHGESGLVIYSRGHASTYSKC